MAKIFSVPESAAASAESESVSLFQSRFRLLLIPRSPSNFAHAFFSPFPGDTFFVFVNFEKMTDFWHFESSLRYPHFPKSISVISNTTIAFKFCIRLLQPIPRGHFFLFLWISKKMTDFWHFESSLRFEKFSSLVSYISSWPNDFKFCIRLLQPIPCGHFFCFCEFRKKWPTLGILKAP